MKENIIKQVEKASMLQGTTINMLQIVDSNNNLIQRLFILIKTLHRIVEKLLVVLEVINLPTLKSVKKQSIFLIIPIYYS